MSCISSLLFTCIPCLCDIKFYKQNKKIKNKNKKSYLHVTVNVLALCLPSA